MLTDDSVLPAHINEQRDLLREFARTTGCKVSYIGRAESVKIAEKFAKAHPRTRDAVNALLLRDVQQHAPQFGGGRGRNLALLLSAGARLAMLDDDLRLPLRRPDFAQPGLDPGPSGSLQAISTRAWNRHSVAAAKSTKILSSCTWPVAGSLSAHSRADLPRMDRRRMPITR